MPLDPLQTFLIYLLYGAAFFAIGAAITSRRKTFANLKIAGLFWLLALFAFTHAFHEWLEMFRHLHLPVHEVVATHVRHISLLLAFVSFLFLFLFGLTMHWILARRARIWLIMSLLILFELFGLVLMLRHPTNSLAFLEIIEYDLRRLLAFPAAFLTGAGFLLYARRLRGLSVRGAGNFTGAGIAFMIYGVWTGLVPSGTVVLLPVEIWRGLSAFVVLHFIMYALDLFLDEREAKIAERLQLAARSEKLSAVGRLAAGVAHEINNPLTSVSLQLELLQQEPTVVALPEKVLARLSLIERNIEKTARIAQELLIFAGGRETSVEFIPVDLARAVNHAWQLAAHRANNYHLHCRLEDLPLLPGIPLKLEELFLNLFLNAMDAMPKGGDIEVTGWQEGKQLIVRVADHGAGFPPGKMGLVLEPFFTTKEIGQGTGLGLAICYGIMELHGGIIEVAARLEGTGAIVTLTFPLGRERHIIRKMPPAQ
ncbi:MAG TPA: two-component sensor histidine kinase [Desulfobulbaceae bacterium]|nr:two-component sensor histidine kinase [Desulfobulbaceae bacterium]